MSRFKKEDWLDLGARLLGQEGPSALTLERLTAAAGRTRGSFYHHFTDRDAFVRALMQRWREREIVIEGQRYAQDASPESWRKRMREHPLELDFRFEREARRLAASEPIVCEILMEVDRARIEGLACLIKQMRPEIEDPQSFAYVQYGALVGLQWLIDDPDDARAPGIVRTANRLFGLSEPEEKAQTRA
ncbi:MAG TPA: helix-turn-helix domain-containing protein [Methylocystis sp.]|nr:helix-turn-helix domain-containing protein [Methylocystis sp.]